MNNMEVDGEFTWKPRIATVDSPPADTVSALEFSPAALQQNYLMAASWDGNVHCWQVQADQIVPKALKNFGASVLSACWSSEGTKLFVGTTESRAFLWDMVSDQVLQVAVHKAPVKTCHSVQSGNCNCLMTGSWDKTIKFWDTRTDTPIMVIDLPERVYCADICFPMAVVGMAQPELYMYSLENGVKVLRHEKSKSKGQCRSLRILKNKSKAPIGYAVAFSDGRVSIGSNSSEVSTFSFKCHRVSSDMNVDIYSVNDLAVNPKCGSLATVGSDGSYAFWDIMQHQKINSFESGCMPITKCCFDAEGKLFAHAMGYDWSKGHEHADPSMKPRIQLQTYN